MEFYSKKNKVLSFTGKWMELENIILSEVGLRRPKITCYPAYAYYRPKTNAAWVTWTWVTLRGDHAQKG
jgi:hypothetical protein